MSESIVLTHTFRYNSTFGRFPWERVVLEWPNVPTGAVSVEGMMLGSVPRGSGVALDIGCGQSRQRFRDGLIERGWSPIGLDLAGTAPDALADAHLLPVRSNSVDLLMTSAVWEHLKHPHHAMSEAARVARPAARFVGSAAFGEPFHISYFHHSPLAVYELLESNGFEVETIVLSDRYSAIYAHLDMGFAGQRVPRVLHSVLARLVREVAILPNTLRGRRRSGRLAFARSHAASVGWIATKRAE